MAFVPVPKDLTKVRTKLVLNLTARQLVCFGLAAGVGIPTYLFVKNTIGSSASVFLMIGVMLPFFFLAMFERDGQPAEKILRNIIRAKFWPPIRTYRTENLYQYLEDSSNQCNSEGGQIIASKTSKTAQGKATAKTNKRKRSAGKSK